MSTVQVVVHEGDRDAVTAAIGARFLTALVDTCAAKGSAHVVVTGGSVGIAMLAAVRESPARDTVDWSLVHVWFGDERFLPAGDPERNETQARAALLDHVPLDPAKVHAMPPRGAAGGDDVHRAAEVHAQELAAHATDGRTPGLPVFDVLILGVGPDAHVASLFPGLPGVLVTDRTVIGVEGSPKPPPERVSLTLPAIDSATEIWFVACGTDKAPAVAQALDPGADLAQVPASGPRGRDLTLWLLDRDAASELPSAG